MIIIAGQPCECGCGCLTGLYSQKGHNGRSGPARFINGHSGCDPRDMKGTRDLVSNEHLRTAFEASSVSAYDVALRMGWFEHGQPDSHRVKQALGLTHYTPGHGYPSRRRSHLTPAVAVRLADAMGLIPAEVGL